MCIPWDGGCPRMGVLMMNLGCYVINEEMFVSICLYLFVCIRTNVVEGMRACVSMCVLIWRDVSLRC